MKKLLLLCLLFAQAGFAQTPRIDSLKRALRTLEKQPDGYGKDSVSYDYVEALMQAYATIQIDSSMRYNARLIQLSRSLGYELSLLDNYVFAGYLNRVKGKYFESVRFLYKALVIGEKRKVYPRIAYIYYSLAHSYFYLKNYQKSFGFCEKALALLKKYPDPTTEMEILNVYGENYKQKKEYGQAIDQYRRISNLAKSNKDIWHEAVSLNEIGLAYQEMGELTKSASFYREALVLAKQTGSFDLEGNILLNLTNLLTTQQNWSEALHYALIIKQRSSAMKNTSLLLDTQKKLHELYKKTGRIRDALDAYEQFVILKDSLSHETNQNRIEALQAQYENVQKENTLKKQQVLLLSQQNNNQQLAQTRNGLFGGIFGILLVAGLLFWNNRRLQSKNQQISQQTLLLESARGQLATINQSLELRVQERTQALLEANAELIRKNEEIKAALFKGQTIERKRVAIELHDNLSSLLSALNMSIQGIDPKGLSEKEQAVYKNIRQMMTNAYAEVRNISHNILPTDLEQKGLCAILDGLVAKLNENTPIHFSFCTTLADRLPVELEFNLYSISLELINNVIRHAQATETSILLSQKPESIQLVISDNGRGFREESKQGMGLQNIQSRLDALGGTFDVITDQLSGTKISLQIPVDVPISNRNL